MAVQEALSGASALEALHTIGRLCQYPVAKHCEVCLSNSGIIIADHKGR
jgi:hypothetical protein